MRVVAVAARNFRNLAERTAEAHPRFNVFHGDNAQGKTNLLEAIYLVGTLRSFRATRNEELIAFGEPSALVRARVLRQGVERLLEVEVSERGKRARVDGKASSAKSYFGGLNVVLFAPEDLRLPKGPPAQRRRFLDRAIWNARPAYLDAAQTYDRILKSRNALLRQLAGRPPADATMLEVYDEQLAVAAAPVVAERHRIVGELEPFVKSAWSRITGGELDLSLRLDSVLSDAAGGVPARMRALLEEDRRKDIARQLTSSGPHTDDLEVLVGGREARLYASQGQLRALVLSLKIAEIEYITAALGDSPALLLDDVSSELDATRNAQLFEFLNEIKSQTFLTTTDPAHLRLTGEVKLFQVVKGSLFE